MTFEVLELIIPPVNLLIRIDGTSGLLACTAGIRGLARGKAFAEDVLVVDTARGSGRVEELCRSAEEAGWRALTLGTRDFVRKCGAERAILGLSGGMDSALVCCIAVEALGADKVTGVLMPSPYTSEDSLTRRPSAGGQSGRVHRDPAH